MSATGGPSTSFRGALGATLKKPAEKEVQAAPLPQVVKVVSPAKADLRREKIASRLSTIEDAFSQHRDNGSNATHRSYELGLPARSAHFDELAVLLQRCDWTDVGARTDGKASTKLARRLRDPLAAMRRPGSAIQLGQQPLPEPKRARRLAPMSSAATTEVVPRPFDDLETVNKSQPVRNPIAGLRKKKKPPLPSPLLEEGGEGGAGEEVGAILEEEEEDSEEEEERLSAEARETEKANKLMKAEEQRVSTKLLSWAKGDTVDRDVLDATRARVWKEERENLEDMTKASNLVLKNRKAQRASLIMKKYTDNKLKRQMDLRQTVLHLWFRVTIQRPEARRTLARAVKIWRGGRAATNIAEIKAADLLALWEVLVKKRVLKMWPRGGMVLRFEKRQYLRRGLGPWIKFLLYQRRWKERRRDKQQSFLYHSFRALYFWKCCAVKVRARALRLFKLAETSVKEFSMPHERFPGCDSLFCGEQVFLCWHLYEWYERRVVRGWYMRLAPLVFFEWSKRVDEGKRTRFAESFYRKNLIEKVMGQFKFLLETNEMGERLHKKLEEAEGLDSGGAKPEKSFDEQKQSDVDVLSGLLDFEHEENMRVKFKEEKRKMLVDLKFEALRNEMEAVRALPAEFGDSIRQFENMVGERDAEKSMKKKELSLLLKSVALDQQKSWSHALQRLVRLWTKATDILAGVFDVSAAKYRAELFYESWLILRKPAGRIRIRRIMNKACLKRLVNICANFRRLENSIHKYRPLRIMFKCFQRWLKYVEYNYQHVSKDLKTSVRRRHELRERLGQFLEEYALKSNSSVIVPTAQQVFSSRQFVFVGWVELVQNKAARRHVEWLTRRRVDLRLLRLSFDFLQHGVIRRGADAQEYLRSTAVFLETRASLDLQIWKVDFFSGVPHTTRLKVAERMRRKTAMKLVGGTQRLPALLQNRKLEIKKRIRKEQDLLLTYFNAQAAAAEAESKSSAPSSIQLSHSFPPEMWATVMYLRNTEIQELNEAVDAFAKRMARQFQSARVCYNLSQWLFAVRCHRLPSLTSKRLPKDKKYWKYLKSLFTKAQELHSGKRLY